VTVVQSCSLTARSSLKIKAGSSGAVDSLGECRATVGSAVALEEGWSFVVSERTDDLYSSFESIDHCKALDATLTSHSFSSSNHSAIAIRSKLQPGYVLAGAFRFSGSPDLLFRAKRMAVTHSNEVNANRHEEIENISWPHEVEQNRFLSQVRRDFKYSLSVTLYRRQSIVRGMIF
jgi:hypothetical protein